MFESHVSMLLTCPVMVIL